MKKVIKAIAIPIKDYFDLLLPEGAEVLSMFCFSPGKAGQSERLELLVMADVEEKRARPRHFVLSMPGLPFDGPVEDPLSLREELRYVGHAVLKKGSKTYVLFEKIGSPGP